MKYSIKKYKGIGLIEVLITTLVVALGLLAVASLQGNLMSTSGSNKVRSEAKSLCENRLEQLRDAATRGVDSSTTAGEYSAIGMASPAVVTGTAPTRTGVTTESGIAGTNETFARVTTVTELINPTRKQISIACSWGNGDDEHKVVVQTVLNFDSLGAAVKVAKPASGAMLGDPSTNAGSSTEIHDSTTVELTTPGTAGTLSTQTEWTGKETGQYLKVNTGGGTASVVYKCTGDTFIAFDVAKGLYTRRIHNPNVAENTGFADAIELAKSNNDTLFDSGTVSSCTRKIRYNGGIMLPIRGAVYSKTSSNNSLIDINLFTFDASESGIYCAFTPASNSTQAPYVCYAGGNCVNGPRATHATTDGITITDADSTHTNAVVTECPYSANSTAPFYPTDAYASVGPGGWRGEVGLLGIPSSNAAHNNVCFAEEVAANPTVLNTARNYFTRRFTSTAARNEGINKPYACHDFLIIDGKNTEAAVHTECASKVGVLKLASKNIMRDFTAATSSTSPLNNVDLTIGKSSCHVITGTVTNGVTAATATSTTGFFDCTVNTTTNTYECYGTALGVNTGTTNSPVYAASVLVSEASPYVSPLTSGYVAKTCTTSLTTSNTNLACNLANAAATRNIAVTVTKVGAGTSDITAVFDNSTTPAFTCVLSTGTTYNCTALTTWAGTIKATSTCNSVAAADATTSSIAAGTTNITASITLPSCAASTNHDLVVTVNKPGTGTKTVGSVTTSGGVTCSVLTTATLGDTYNCLVDNTWSGTVSATSTCNSVAVATQTANVSLNAATATIDLPSCAAVNYTLTVTAPSNGAIQETANLTNIDCGSTCTHAYTDGTSVFLSAVPNTGYAFSSWGGVCSAVTTSTCTVDMTAAKSVSATFKKKITGTITLGTQASNSSLVVSAGAVTCDSSAGTSYFCLVDSSVNPVISISVAGCSTPPSGGKKQDITSSVTGTAVQGTGSVSASFTATSATTTSIGPNFTISRSSLNCP